MKGEQEPTTQRHARIDIQVMWSRNEKKLSVFHLNLRTLLPGNDVKAMRYVSVSEAEWSQRFRFAQDWYYLEAMQVFCVGQPRVILVPFKEGSRVLYKRNDTSCLCLSAIFRLFSNACLGWDEVSCWFYSQPQWTTEFLMESCWPPQMQSSTKAANTRSPTNTH